MNAARLSVRFGLKQPLADASPSPTETVGGIRPLPRPALTSPLAKTVPCLLSRGLMFLPVYRRLSCSGLSLLVPLGVTPSWALVLLPPITHLTPNLSFPLMELTTPLCWLRIKYYAHVYPCSIDSSIVCDQGLLSVTFSSFSYLSSMCYTSYLGPLVLQGLIGHSTILSHECLSHGFFFLLSYFPFGFSDPENCGVAVH